MKHPIAICLGVALCLLPSSLLAQVSFGLSSSPAVGNNPRAVVAADVNGDGKMDLISANQNAINANSLSVLTNDGSGGFVLAATIPTGSQPYSVDAADFNGDGRMDLVCANYGGNSISVFTNDGTGGFAPLITVPVGSHPKSVIAIDVNGDHRPDIIAANSSSSTLSVLLNQGSGFYFTAVNSSPATGTSPANVVAADVNGDGKPDMVVSCVSATPNAFTICTNDGTGTFTAAPAPSNLFHTSWVTAADVNADGRMDVICLGTSSSGNALSVYTNNGTGTFTLASTATTGTTPYAIVAVDVNGDGKLDLVTPNQGNNTMTILTNNGSSGFVLAASPTVGSGPEALASADVNSDGRPDLITGNWNVATLSVMTNSTPFPPPSLRIARTGSQILVSWPSPSTGWTLRQNADLTTTGWTPSTGISDDGTNKSISIVLPAGPLYFRLSNP